MFRAEPGWVFLSLPIGNADAVVRYVLLWCLSHPTPVEPFGIIRSFCKLASILITVTFQVECNIKRRQSGNIPGISRESVTNLGKVWQPVLNRIHPLLLKVTKQGDQPGTADSLLRASRRTSR